MVRMQVGDVLHTGLGVYIRRCYPRVEQSVEENNKSECVSDLSGEEKLGRARGLLGVTAARLSVGLGLQGRLLLRT